MSNILSYVLCFGWIPLLLMGLLGLLLGWLLWGKLFGAKHEGDLTIEGEGALRAEADGLRTRIRELEGNVSTRDTEIKGLNAKLAAVPAAAAVATAAPAAAAASDDDGYALEWRNRYLAARVKYLEGRLADAPKAPVKKVVAKKKAAPKKKATVKKVAAKKPVAKKKAAPKPKVLYTDGPTDGAPDDLKLIKGIGPKFEKDLNGKGVYYFRQIAAWKDKDVKMVEGVIDSFPGRIGRDEWIKQAKGLAAGGKPRAMKAAPKIAKKSTSSKSKAKKSSSTAKKSTSAAGNKYDKYYTNVKKYDSGANRGTVEAIAKYCGASLASRDTSLVACSDPSEVATVVKNFTVKKLGLDKARGEKIVAEVCQDLKAERFKNRVTFYYFCAKKAGKLGVFG